MGQCLTEEIKSGKTDEDFDPPPQDPPKPSSALTEAALDRNVEVVHAKFHEEAPPSPVMAQPVAVKKKPVVPRVKSYIGPADAEAQLMIKTIIVGDGGCGKTCLLARLMKEPFSDEYEATMFDYNDTTWESEREDGATRTLEVSLTDTAGQEGFEGIRATCYPGHNIYLISFNCISVISLNNLLGKWVPEVKTNFDEDDDENLRPGHAGTEPWLIMIGCKADMDDAKNTLGRDEEIAEELDVCALIRTSAKVEDTASVVSGIDDLENIIKTLACMYRDGEPKPSWKDFKYPETDPNNTTY